MRLRKIDLIRALRRCTTADPVPFVCPCGCGHEMAFARDSVALWICDGVGTTPHVTSIRSKDELERFLVTTRELVADVAYRELRDLTTHLWAPN